MGLKFTSGSIFQGLAMIGGGILGVHEGVPTVGWGLIAVGAFALFFDIHLEQGRLQFGSIATLSRRLTVMWPQLVMIVSFIGFMISLTAFLQKNASTNASSPPKAEKQSSGREIVSPSKPPTLPNLTTQPAPIALAPVAEKPKPAAPLRLKRFIAYENISVEFTAKEGGFSISGFNLPVRNAGDDTIEINVERFSIGVNEEVPFKLGSFKRTFLPPTQTMPWHFSLSSSNLAPESKVINVEFEVDYDTTPATGMRRSYKKLAFAIIWPNGMTNAPQTVTSITDEWER